MHRQILCGLLLALFVPNPLFGESPFRFVDTPGKLPKDVVPKSYDIHIKPEIAKHAFTGSETVVIEVSQPVKTITLNANAITIPSAKLLSDTGEMQQTATVALNSKEQTATLAFDHEITAGTYTLALDFAGTINEAGQGLYYVTYRDEGNGEEKTMLSTQMEPTDARRMFPCWDEPSFRARFRLTATVPENFTTVSNMPIEGERPTNGGKEVRFGETPSMASYLVVFCAGELDAIHGEADGVKIGIYTTKGKAGTGRYALESAEKILHYYNEYFGIEYSLPKLDLIAVPGGFGGAMENWGGIVFYESTLLFDPTKSSEETKERIFGITAHEMAHQWFGNLVTMAWWDHLWLNEGFASWMGTKCSDHFNPQWELRVRANGSKEQAMATDSLSTTHPIQQLVKTEAEAQSAFDEITYQKGQAFIGMLESYLGEDTFRAGIRNYMQSHQYSNSTTTDLWNALGTASNRPVSDVAASWTQQPGLPIVSLRRTDSGLSISQERFTIHQTNPKMLTWKIPIAYRTLPIGQNESEIKVTLLAQESATLPDLAATQAVKLNAGNRGFYRVQYDPAYFQQLLAAMTQLPDADKMNLLCDSWALVQAGRGSVADYFQLVEAVRMDTNLAVWEPIIHALSAIDNLYRGSSDRAAYRTYVRTILKPVFDRVGWEPRPSEKVTDGLLRVALVKALGEFDEPEMVAEASFRFQKFLNDPASLAPDLRLPVFDIVGRSADRKTWEQLHKLGRETQNIGEKRNFYSAMALARPFAADTLALALGTELPTVAGIGLIQTVADCGEEPERAWKFIQEHRAALDKKLDSLGQIRFVPAVAGAFNDAAHADELEDYARKTLPPDSQSKVNKVAETIRFKADFKARLLPQIAEWIKAH